jgi:hypothetical protein
MKPLAAAFGLTLSVAGTAHAQTFNISPDDRRGYSENGGWMEWQMAGDPVGSEAVRVRRGVFRGFVWMENFGWLNVGRGEPANGVAYSNTTGADFGVNILPSGLLSGFAWGENIGWVKFDLPTLPPAQHARYDAAALRLRGYAWGENIGWVNLDSAEAGKFVGVRVCPVDYNEDGVLNPDDLADYIVCFFEAPPCDRADYDNSGFVNPDDLSDFITAYFMGCP